MKETVTICGLKFAKENIGTDAENPNGKYYTFDQAQAACPDGWRLPTKEEWAMVVKGCTYFFDKETKEGVFTDKESGAQLRIPAAGFRNYSGGGLGRVGSDGYCWSGSPLSTTNGYFLSFYSGNVFPSDFNNRSFGFSVRLIKK